MNAQKGRANFKNLLIQLDIRCSSKILMGSLMQNNNSKKDNMILCHTQTGIMTTNLNVK